MNELELKEFLAKREPSDHVDEPPDHLPCFGCAHSAALEPYPSFPSGERPCCSCIRNPKRDDWAQDQDRTLKVLIDDEGTARCFNPFVGFAYNGMPYVDSPMDNYVTMAQRKQEKFMDAHPEYKKSIRMVGHKVKVVDDE